VKLTGSAAWLERINVRPVTTRSSTRPE
jgi:hypothetical protein